METSKPDLWIRRLLVAYVFVVPLRRLYFLPGLGSRFQLTEVVFLLLGPLLAYALFRKQSILRVSLLSVAFAAYLLVLAAATFSAYPTATQLVELLGRVYLFVLLLGFSAYLAQWPDGIPLLLRAWSWGSVTLGASAYLGYALAVAGYVTPLVSVYENYPYFGTLYRSTGVAGGATAFVALCILPCALDYRRWRTGISRFPRVALFLAVPLLLTFSKELLLLLLALAVVEPVLRKQLLWPIVVLGAGVYWFSAHYLVQVAGANERYATEEFSSGRVVYEGSHFRLLETSYTSLKRAAVHLTSHHPWIGVGADGFPLRLPGLKEEGLYPSHLPDYIPHSTWFGALAEVGLLGCCALLLLVYALAKTIGVTLRGARPSAEDWCLSAFFLAMAIGSLNMDLLHLRFFWVAAALVSARYFSGQLTDHAA